MINGFVEVVIDPGDTRGENEYWSKGLILFAIGEELFMSAVKVFMNKAWKFVSMPELYFHEDEYFIARFSKPDEREVMARGSYTKFSAPSFLRNWSKGFVKSEEMIRLMLIWVTFPKLPIYLWGA